MDEIFGHWPSMASLARDIGANPIAVRHWKLRGSMPADYDLLIVKAAEGRGFPVSLEQLALARATASGLLPPELSQRCA